MSLEELDIALRALGNDFIEIVWGEVTDDDFATYQVKIDPGKLCFMYSLNLMKGIFTIESLILHILVENFQT